MDKQRAQRKNEHLSLAEKFYQKYHQEDPFDGIQLLPNALPEMSVKDAKPQTQLADLSSQWPFYLEAITGGSPKADLINQQLAKQAAKHGLAMATGSMSVIFNNPDARAGFEKIRQVNPDGVILANLSAHASLDQAKTAVELVNADALEIHLNVAQELIMPEGKRDFKVVDNLARLAASLEVPIIVKEVGFGMTKETIQQLIHAGITWINVSGRGGTNFAAIENRRNHENNFDDLLGWGISTAESLLEAHDLPVNIIASGGITSPLQVIKAACLGAKTVGVAGYFLHQLMQGGEGQLDRVIDNWQTEILRIMTMLGVKKFADLSSCPFVLNSELMNYVQQRKIKL